MKKLVSMPFRKTETETVISNQADLSSITESAPAPNSEGTGDELGRLRDILFGSQSRTLEKRLSDLEIGLGNTKRELTDTLNDKIQALSDSSSAQLSSARGELTAKMDGQNSDLASQLPRRAEGPD